MRWLALLLLVPALAGCVTQSQQGEQPPKLLGGGALGDIVAEGATILRHADAVELVWRSTAQTVAPASALGLPAALPDPTDAANALLAHFTMPQEVTGLVADLKVPPGVDLDFYINDARIYDCRSRQGTDGDLQHEHCRAYIPAGRTGPETWTAQVVNNGNPGPAAPFELHLELTAHAFQLLGDPLPAAQRDARLAFAHARVDPELGRTAEPSLKVDDTGTAWVADRTTSTASLWKTRDGARFDRVDILGHSDAVGQAWGAVGNGGGDSDVAVTPDGKEVYFADLSGQCITIAGSSDAGATWSVNPLSCNVPLDDRQWIAAKPGGHLWLTYNAQDPATFALDQADVASQLTVMHSIDGGRSWLQRATVPQDSCARGNLVVDQDMRVIVAGCDAQGPAVAVSEDSTTFTWHHVADRPGAADGDFCSVCGVFPVVAADSAGNLYLAWADQTLGTWHVFLSHSTDHGATWSPPVRVDRDEGTTLMPWIAARAPGQVALAFYTSRLPHDEFEYEGGPATNASFAGEWYIHAAESVDALGEQPHFAEAAVQAEPIQYGPICLMGAACKSHRNLLDFLMVDLGKDGSVHVAYADGTRGGAVYDSYVMYGRSAGLPMPASSEGGRGGPLAGPGPGTRD